MTLYHATFTRHIPNILLKGICAGRRQNWRRGSGTTYNRDCNYVYAFTERSDAILWAGKMEWEFFPGKGAGKIAVIHLAANGPWIGDDNDPLSRSACRGKWVKRLGDVPPDHIMSVELIIPRLIRDTISERNAEIRLPLGWAARCAIAP